MFKIIRLKDTSQIAVVTASKPNIGINLNNVRREASRDLYRGINEFKRCYQPRNNLVKNVLADSHNIRKSWKKYCFVIE
jgi:hypothetical protein